VGAAPGRSRRARTIRVSERDIQSTDLGERAPRDAARSGSWRGGRDLERSSVANTDLSSDLRRAVQGEVRFDRGSRALYATDASNYRQVPIGVVVLRHIVDVPACWELCRR